MLRRLIYLAVAGLVAMTTLSPVEAWAESRGYYHQVYGQQNWQDHRDFRITTEPRPQVYIQPRHYHPGYSYYNPYVYVAPTQPIWVPASWHWNGYQWVWIPGYWSW